MTDIMVDVETTGTDPEMAGIIQLSAIKFNLQTLTIGDHFDACPALLPRRTWSDSTKEFWMIKNAGVFRTIVERQEPAAPVYAAFDRWVSQDAPDGGYQFWSKPLKFDWPLVESHMIQVGLDMPFPHWRGMDLHSYIAGLRGTVTRTNIEEEIPFNGAKHNALHDVAYQIDLLFHAKRNHIQVEYV